MLRPFLFPLAFTVLVSLSACVSPPSGLNLALDRPTADEKYHIAIRPLAEPVTINKIHAWEVRLRTPSGEPVSDAKIGVGGGMPQHGHGFPTQPRVTKDLGNGRYLLEGMKFSMPGWWEIRLTVDTPSGTDEVKFNTIIGTRAAPPMAATDTAQR
ncbi:FixH family protein [Noviherbaspirillum sp.]|uniref:FixH family protein n=1 Tax=Noviherbaspirillum sp. TaxID=1926288 RepID=UPI002FE00FA8